MSSKKLKPYVSLASFVSLSIIVINTQLGLSHFDSGKQNIFVPHLNVLALVLPFGFSVRRVTDVWKTPWLLYAYPIFVCFFCALASSSIIVLTATWWLGGFKHVYPSPLEVVDGSFDASRNATSLLACFCATIVTLAMLHKTANQTYNKANGGEARPSNLVSFLFTIAWAVAIFELCLSLRMAILPSAVWSPAESCNSVLISGIMTWLSGPRKKRYKTPQWLGIDTSQQYALVLLVYISFGLILSIIGWVMDIQQVETASTYLDARSYHDMFNGGNVSRPIRMLYVYDLPGESAISSFVSMTISYQIATIFWIVIGVAVCTLQLSRGVKGGCN